MKRAKSLDSEALAKEFPPLTDVAPIQELQRPFTRERYADDDPYLPALDLYCANCPNPSPTSHTLHFYWRDVEARIEPLFYPNVWLDGSNRIPLMRLQPHIYEQDPEMASEYWFDVIPRLSRDVPGEGWFTVTPPQSRMRIDLGTHPHVPNPSLVRDVYSRHEDHKDLHGKYQLACSACGGGQISARQERFERVAIELYAQSIEQDTYDGHPEDWPGYRPRVSLQYLAKMLEESAQRLSRFNHA